MPITFNANEILEMAEEIETNGAKFYRKAAKSASDERTKQMLLDMAAMEDGHLKTYQEIRKGLSQWEKEETIFDPDNQSVKYLQAMAEARGYEGKITPSKELTGSETIKEILDIALNSEKESALFYLGLKDLVPERAGREKIENIILEELSHITTLLKQLKALN
jgi:rubrerythrin